MSSPSQPIRSEMSPCFSAVTALLADQCHSQCFERSFPPSLAQMGSAVGVILSAEHVFIFSRFKLRCEFLLVPWFSSLVPPLSWMFSSFCCVCFLGVFFTSCVWTVGNKQCAWLMNTAGNVSFLIGLWLRPYVTAETSIIDSFLDIVMDWKSAPNETGKKFRFRNGHKLH